MFGKKIEIIQFYRKKGLILDSNFDAEMQLSKCS